MILRIFMDMLFCGICSLCNRPGENVCRGCEKKFVPEDFSESIETSDRFLFDKLIISMDYAKNDFLRETIFLFKYESQKHLSNVLAAPMKKQFFRLKEIVPEGDNLILVPVPLHKKKKRKRGFNQSLLLAKKIEKRKVADCLERTVYLSDQAKLTKKQRLQNLKGSIQVKDKLRHMIKDRHFVVVDDVATTGSTLNECARALKEFGAKTVYGLVLAKVR